MALSFATIKSGAGFTVSVAVLLAVVPPQVLATTRTVIPLCETEGTKLSNV